jgi:hypothetical protein
MARPVSVAVFAVAATFAVVTAARATEQCTIPDFLTAAGDTASTVSSGQCAAANSNSSLWILVIGLATAVAAADGQGQQACTAIQNVLGTPLSDAQKVTGIANKVNNLNLGNVQQALGDAAQEGLSDATAAVNYLNIASCACSMEAALSQDVQVLGACIQDVLCDGDKLLNDPCTCTPVPPQLAQCTQNSQLCGSFNASAPQSGQVNNCQQNLVATASGSQSSGPVTVVTQGALGTTVTSTVNGQSANGVCSPVTYCICPKPMVPTWVPYDPQDESSPGGGGTCPDGSPASAIGECMFICACPAGSSPPSNKTGPVSSTCVCNNGPDAGNAIPPDGCAPVCKGNQVPVAGGSCCDPSQVAACGTCCPEGQVPDSTTGKCKSLISTPIHSPRL